MKPSRFLSIHVLSVVFLIGFIYYETIFVFIDDWYGLQSSAGLLNCLIFSFLASLCIFSLFFCVLADPGGVPSGYVPDVEDNQSFDLEAKRNSVHTRHCDKCSVHKPPRAHHCRVCRRCVLRMDHHCSWINNCVGLRNYKSFLLLVFYATVASTYSATVIICCTLTKNWDFTDNHPVKALHIVCGVTSIGISLVLGSLLVWHIFLTCRNMTTIEYYEAKRAAWLARKSGLSYHHPYDVGSFKNISLIWGPNMLRWLWPSAVSHIKDGLNFPTTSDTS